MIGRGKVGGLIAKAGQAKQGGLAAAMQGKAPPRQGLGALLRNKRDQLAQRAPEPVVSQTQPAPAPTQTLQPAQPQPMVSAQPVGAGQEIGQPAAPQAAPAQKVAQAPAQAARRPMQKPGGRLSGLPLRSKFLRRGRT